MASEMRGFVFAIVFIIIFAGMLSAVPSGLNGEGATPDNITPVDPSLISGFDDSENYTNAVFSNYQYSYSLISRTWVCFAYGDASLQLGAKIIYAGFLWLGGYDMVSFGERGQSLTWAEIEADAEEGRVNYPMLYITTGDSAGTFVIYWNTTLYSDPEDAWNADKLYIVHGVGFGDSATSNIGSLLVSLLLLQLPDVPVLINLLIVTPIWACIIFVLWFVIKEMIPFV